MTIMFVCLLFSVIMPITTFFGLFFFVFRYYIEKYNMLFVFVKDFGSHGTLRRKVIWHLIFSVLGFQLINYVFFSVIGENSGYMVFGLIFMMLQVMGIFIFNKTFGK